MNKSAAPIICEKCHTRRLSPVLDKGHRWCKKCRAAAYAALTQKPDERRKSRAGYEYTAALALLRAAEWGQPVAQVYATAKKTNFLIGRKGK